MTFDLIGNNVNLDQQFVTTDANTVYIFLSSNNGLTLLAACNKAQVRSTIRTESISRNRSLNTEINYFVGPLYDTLLSS